MATGDGKRDTNFTKVVAMVTGIPCLLYHTSELSTNLLVPEEANLEWQSFCNTIVLYSMCYAQICAQAHKGMYKGM